MGGGTASYTLVISPDWRPRPWEAGTLLSSQRRRPRPAASPATRKGSTRARRGQHEVQPWSAAVRDRHDLAGRSGGLSETPIMKCVRRPLPGCAGQHPGDGVAQAVVAVADDELHGGEPAPEPARLQGKLEVDVPAVELGVVARPRKPDPNPAAQGIEVEPRLAHSGVGDIPGPCLQRIELRSPAAGLADDDASRNVVLDQPLGSDVYDNHGTALHTRPRRRSRITVGAPASSMRGV